MFLFIYVLSFYLFSIKFEFKCFYMLGLLIFLCEGEKSGKNYYVYSGNKKVNMKIVGSERRKDY